MGAATAAPLRSPCSFIPPSPPPSHLCQTNTPPQSHCTPALHTHTADVDWAPTAFPLVRREQWALPQRRPCVRRALSSLHLHLHLISVRLTHHHNHTAHLHCTHTLQTLTGLLLHSHWCGVSNGRCHSGALAFAVLFHPSISTSISSLSD